MKKNIMKKMICVKGASNNPGLLAKLVFIDGDKPATVTDIQGWGKTAEEAMGALVLGYGDAIPELQAFRQGFSPEENDLGYVGKMLMKTAERNSGMVISVMIDTMANWPAAA